MNYEQFRKYGQLLADRASAVHSYLLEHFIKDDIKEMMIYLSEYGEDYIKVMYYNKAGEEKFYDIPMYVINDTTGTKITEWLEQRKSQRV